MANRLDAISVLNDLKPKISATAKTQSINALYKIIAVFASGTSLDEVRTLTRADRSNVMDCVSEGATLTQLKKISKAWDSKRMVVAGTSFSQLQRELVELLDGTRAPYEAPKMTLSAALAMGQTEKAALADNIERFATAPHLKSLVKKWDKHGADPKTQSLPKLRQRALSLLYGDAKPKAPPPKPSRKK